MAERAQISRHPRFAHSESCLSGPALRLRHSAAHRTDFTRALLIEQGALYPALFRLVRQDC